MTRDHDWNIATFHPVATNMYTFPISYCNSKPIDAIAPVITLHGANPLTLTLSSDFIDPGAEANDNIDGDLSTKIQVQSNLNTDAVGSYAVTYSAMDEAGNTASKTRTIIVQPQPQTGIVIDGNNADWNLIPALTSSGHGYIKVSDDEENLYILVDVDDLGENNTQILLDTDSSTSTGLILNNTLAPWEGGMDYMIEQFFR